MGTKLSKQGFFLKRQIDGGLVHTFFLCSSTHRWQAEWENFLFRSLEDDNRMNNQKCLIYKLAYISPQEVVYKRQIYGGFLVQSSKKNI